MSDEVRAVLTYITPGEARWDTDDHEHQWYWGNNVLGGPFEECSCGATRTTREVLVRRIDWLCQWHYTTGTSDDECPEPGKCRYVDLPKGTLVEVTDE